MSSELSGVRSSCDMLARNCDLYFEVSASCSAFSSTSCLASSTSRFFLSTSSFCRVSWRAFSSSSSLVCCSSSCCVCSSSAMLCDWRSSSSVRMVASMVATTMPSDSSSWSMKASWTVVKGWKEASSMTPLTSLSKRMGTTTMFSGAASPSAEPIMM